MKAGLGAPKTNELLNTRINMTFGIVAAIVVVAAGLVFWLVPTAREALTFLAVCCAAAGQLAVALYTVRILQFSINSQADAAGSAAAAQEGAALAQIELEKMRLAEVAAKFGERWTEASMFHARRVFDELLEHKSDGERVAELIKGSRQKETNVKNVLNFLEQLSYWVLTARCSEAVAKDLFAGIAINIWHATETWVKYQRAHRGRPQLWAQLESLYIKWK
jgi:Domain of unknown function (DUF4760)